jgi:outer membrane protein assembly factor BamA
MTRRILPSMVGLALLLAAAVSAQEVSQTERLAEVRVHGNHTTPDEDVLRIAGLAVGQAIDASAVSAARERLAQSGRFERVEIRTRYRSLEPGGDVTLVIVVIEHPVPDVAMPGSPAARPFRRLFASGMFLPILQYTDGYGFTYGGRVSFVDLWGRGSRVSVPASWGGTKRVAVELERTLSHGPIDRVVGSLSISRRTNPFYDIDEDRRDARIEASKQLATHLRGAGHVSYGSVDFGALGERVASYGADLTFDTRMDPVFPRNAVYASAGWERLDPSVSASVNRFQVDARAYRGLIGQSVLSVRAQYAGADGAQPAYARYLLGGAGTLRGYRAGSFSGDNLAAASAELRVPVTSTLRVARAGVSVFFDAGSVWDHGESFSSSRVKKGGGAGIFLLASLFQLSLDVGFREGGGTRIHFTTGLQF